MSSLSPESAQREADRPKVSVALLTYNHAAFIEDTLEGILRQETGFALEVVVADDCSSDGTLERVRAKLDGWKWPMRILPRSQNLGMMRNFASLLGECRGEFIAVVEGDDYWTDPEKLQRQVAFLERHPEAALCHHRVTYWSQPRSEAEGEFPAEEFRGPLVSPGRLAGGNFIQTCSVLLRRAFLPQQFDPGFLALKMGDWPLFALVGQHGAIGYLDRNMAVYRLHQASYWSTQSMASRLRGGEAVRAYLIARLDRESRKPWLERAVQDGRERLIAAQVGGRGREAGQVLVVLGRLAWRCGQPGWTEWLRLLVHSAKVFFLRWTGRLPKAVEAEKGGHS